MNDFWREAWKLAVPAWLFSRLWNAIFVYLGHLQHPFREPIVDGFEGVSNWWLNPWTTFDSRHFLSIASGGYTLDLTPFFPFYPLLMRPFGPDANALALAGILISNVAFLGALIGFYALTRRDYSERVARTAVWVLAFFPVGAATMAVYTESLFLLCGVATFWFFRAPAPNPTPYMGAVVGFLAALIRNTGPILSLAMGWEWLEKQRRERRLSGPTLLIAICPVLAFVAVQLYFRARFGETMATVGAQEFYHRSLTVPGWPVLRDLGGLFVGAGWDITTLLNLAATLVAFFLVWRYRGRQPRADAVLIVGVLAVHLTLARDVPPYTHGSLRYLLALWPFSQLLALAWHDFPRHASKPARYSALVLGLSLVAVTAFLWGRKSFPG